MTAEDWIAEVQPLVDARDWAAIARKIEVARADRNWTFNLHENVLRTKFEGVFTSRYLAKNDPDFWTRAEEFKQANPNFAQDIWDAIKNGRVDETVSGAFRRRDLSSQ